MARRWLHTPLIPAHMWFKPAWSYSKLHRETIFSKPKKVEEGGEEEEEEEELFLWACMVLDPRLYWTLVVLSIGKQELSTRVCGWVGACVRAHD